MMTPEQTKIVKLVYNRFIGSESNKWNEIDDNLEFVSYLNDKELIEEVRVKLEKHSWGTFRCNEEHAIEICFAPIILESVLAIDDLYKATGELHEKNRYILTYFMTMCELGLIYST